MSNFGILEENRAPKIWGEGAYEKVFERRAKLLKSFDEDIENLKKVVAIYAKNPICFIEDQVMTIDPRKAKIGLGKMPFVLWPIQKKFIQYLTYLMEHNTSGVVEKCRDMGATWLCCAFSVWLWLFKEDATIMWMTKKSQMLDNKGDPNCIFEKIRFIIRELPDYLIPEGFNDKEHLTIKKLVNPFLNTSITGASGHEGGRSGRAIIVFKDESAHYERPDEVEAGASELGDVQVDISSVNGSNNLFFRKAKSSIPFDPNVDPKGASVLFVMRWEHSPEKTVEWYLMRRAKAIRQGTITLFAQEIDRDYGSCIEGTLIKEHWIRACKDAHLYLDMNIDGDWYAGVDVAGCGNDLNAYVARKGVIVRQIEEWGDTDPTTCADKVINYSLKKRGVKIQYDANGVGLGVGGEFNRRIQEKEAGYDLDFQGLKGQQTPFDPHYPVYDSSDVTNIDFFANLKAQGWWRLKNRIYLTYLMVKNKGKIKGVLDSDMISFPSKLPNLEKLMIELSQPTVSKTARGGLLVDKTPSGTSSPNLADALMMSFHIDENNKVTGINENSFISRG